MPIAVDPGNLGMAYAIAQGAEQVAVADFGPWPADGQVTCADTVNLPV